MWLWHDLMTAVPEDVFRYALGGDECTMTHQLRVEYSGLPECESAAQRALLRRYP